MKKEDLAIVKDMGFRQNIKGYQRLIELIDMAVSGDITPGGLVKEGYYEIAKIHNSTPQSVERTVRYALIIAHNDCPEKFEEIFHMKNCPANGAFIFFMANKIRTNGHL